MRDLEAFGDDGTDKTRAKEHKDGKPSPGKSVYHVIDFSNF
jgi:hypothetical protein